MHEQRQIRLAGKTDTIDKLVHFYTRPDEDGRRRMDCMCPERMAHIFDRALRAPIISPQAAERAAQGYFEIKNQRHESQRQEHHPEAAVGTGQAAPAALPA